MKKLNLILALLISLSSCALMVVDNYSFFKLFVTNEKNEVMLVKWKDAWEIPGKRYKGSKTVNEFVDLMASNHGIGVDKVKLNALITFHYNTRPNPTLMQYYTAKYSSGDLQIPLGCSDIKWVKLEEAYKLIPYTEMVNIMQHIKNDETVLWGAAYDVIKKSTTTPRSSTLREDFYKL